MKEPKASRPYWPDFGATLPDSSKGLKPWRWAVERLERSHNYWISTASAQGRPHLMLVWGVWWEDSFWFSTGPRTRKARNIAANSYCVIATETSDEAVIVEGTPCEVKDRAVWKRFAAVYDAKYGGDVEPLLVSSGGNVYRVEPRVVFAQDEHAQNFVESVTRWKLGNPE